MEEDEATIWEADLAPYKLAGQTYGQVPKGTGHRLRSNASSLLPCHFWPLLYIMILLKTPTGLSPGNHECKGQRTRLTVQ